jgi:drug/metabolite transporter (DMT)-like permease
MHAPTSNHITRAGTVSLNVFAVVMAAALLHATWNALLKSSTDKLLATIMVMAGAAAVAVAALPFLTSPSRASWPYAALSSALQIFYFLLVAATYKIADLSQAYPLMRGTAPLLVAAVSAFEGSDSLSFVAWTGVIGICTGVFCMAAGSIFRGRRGVYLAMLNAVVIAAYTLIDGRGVRYSGSPAAYTLWVFLLSGLPLTAWAFARRGSAFVSYVARHWRIGTAGGLGATTSYGLALWAMTLAPVAVVAALRETSILFATAIAVLVLKEQVGRIRLFAACIIASGAAILRLA